MTYDAVLTYHTNTETCGVAKWNAALARHLQVPCRPLDEWVDCENPLVSIKPQEMSEDVLMDIWRHWNRPLRYGLFLHGTPTSLLHHIWHKSHTTYAANRRIKMEMRDMRGIDIVGELWCPGTVGSWQRIRKPDGHQVFGFGMAHKAKLHDYHQLLGPLLTAQPYRFIMSTAFHENTPWEIDMQAVKDELHAVYGHQGVFAGFLSDAFTARTLEESDACAAFFADGVKTNNTTVLAAMDLGCPVITNLSQWSPVGFEHGLTCLDIEQVDRLADYDLEQIGRHGQQLVRDLYSWERLIERLSH